MGPADPSFVDAGELLPAVVEALLLDGAAVPVEMPALQRRGALVGAEELRAEHGGVAHHVEHDPVAAGLVEGVHRVEDVAGLDVVPDDVGRVAVAGKQADPGVVAVLPAVREAAPAAAASMLNVTGRSSRTMKRSVMAQSCTLTEPPMVTRRAERTRASASMTVTSTSSPQPQK